MKDGTGPASPGARGLKTRSDIPTRGASYTERDGWCWLFGAIDQCVDGLVSWHVARGFQILRYNGGLQSIADAWINGVRWLGMTITRCIIERFTGALKAQCLYLHRFRSLAEAHRISGES